MGFFDFLNPVGAITGLIGGIQGSSAAHDAAAAQRAGYGQAATTVNNAVNNANPIIKGAAQAAGSGLTQAAQQAGAGATGAAQVAGQGVGSAYGQAAGLVNPYIQTGNQANTELQALTAPGANVQQIMQQIDPGYAFRLQQGEQGVQQSQAANGLLQSGATLRALQNYGQNYASSEYQNTYNRLAGLAGMGLSAGQTLGAQGIGTAEYQGNTGINAAQYAGNLGYGAAGQSGQWGVNAGNLQAQNLINAGVYQGNTQIQSGNATAQGDIGAANAWNGALNSIGANFSPFGGFGGGSNPYLQYGAGSPVGTSPMGSVSPSGINANIWGNWA